MIFTLAGLVIDGGRQLGARSRAVGYAQEAARVGAATIELNSAEAKIDIAKAGTAVADFCAQVSANDPAVTVVRRHRARPQEDLTVEVTIDNKTTFLGMVGIGNLDATGTGEAHAEQGVTKADDSPTDPADRRSDPAPTARATSDQHRRPTADPRPPVPDAGPSACRLRPGRCPVPVPGQLHAEHHADDAARTADLERSDGRRAARQQSAPPGGGAPRPGPRTAELPAPGSQL